MIVSNASTTDEGLRPVCVGSSLSPGKGTLMKRVLVLALVAVAGVLAAGSSAKADHFRSVGHHHGGYYGGGYNRGYSRFSYRPSYGVGIGIGYGAPVYRQSYGGYGGYGGGYAVPSYGYGVPVYGYSAPVYSYGGYGGGYCR
jgi:hypothetical protein